MVDIIIKDKLRASVEAASDGKQTVLYTAKGQPTYMNILEKFGNAVYGSADAMGAIHPAFYYADRELDQLFIGTYKGVIVNGELLSLPYQDLAAGTDSMRTTLEAARACGRGFHQLSYVEHSAVAYFGINNGGLNLGNQNLGADTTGHKGVFGGGFNAACTKTGSGGYTWTHDGTVTGIHDVAGGGWEFASGLRVVGDELQIQGNNGSYDYESADSHFSGDWWAIDATTGGRIVPTSTGTINTSDFKATTANSIRIANSTENLAATAIAQTVGWDIFRLDRFAFGAGISEFCKSQLKTFGVIPVSSLDVLNSCYLRVPDDIHTVTYFVRGGAINTGQASGMFASGAIVNSDTMTISNNYGRPCYIEI